MAAILPSQKQDGDVSQEKTKRGTALGPSCRVPHSGAPFQTALVKLGEKILDPASVERELGWETTSLKDNPEE